ncbi:DUF4190 domain-containing protein [Nocardia fluminea]|uniref:DUF4190 domain-containing protein n=1 Tax=Nocardia fluminea TaxID=134984 RepID=UPI00366308F1
MALSIACFIVAGLIFTLPLLLGAIIIAVCTVISGARQSASPKKSRPIAYTDTGEPIYPIVGYTADGTPVTANPLPQGFNPRTNSLAVVALVLGVLGGPIAIPFGHSARSQIRRTGEQGAGMAMAGLILGYISLLALAIFIIALSGIMSG